jgi:hypothetical protein
MPLNWYAGPWIWDATLRGGAWRPPAGLGGLDLRSLPKQSTQGGTPGMGVFWGNVAPAALENRSDYASLGAGSWYDLKPTGAVRNKIPRRKGYTPKGDDLAGVLLDLLTDGASPDGSDGPKPLFPGYDGRMALACGQTHTEQFRWGGGHTAVLRQTLRADFKTAFDDAAAGRIRPGQHRRVLDAMCEKYGVDDWREFVPPAIQGDVPGRLPHETSISETFDQADSTTIGPLLSWTKVAGSWRTVSNKVGAIAGGWNVLRADSDLSSADHYSQATITNAAIQYAGPACRIPSSGAVTMYQCSTDFSIYIFKLVSGSQTNLGSASQALTLNDVYKIEANGSTIKAYVNGTQKVSVTDTSITGNVRCGLGQFGTGDSTLDTFTAADLAAAGIVYTQLERGTRGLLRGMWTGRG